MRGEPSATRGYGAAHEPHGRRFWIMASIGFTTIGFGVREYLLATPDLDRRVNFVAFLVGADLVHDLVVAPVVCGLGALAARLLPSRTRAPIEAGLIASGVVLVLAVLPLRATAARTNNPTIQPLDYASATLTVLSVVWLISAAWLIIGLLRRSRELA